MPGAILPIPRRYNYGRPTEYVFGSWQRGLITKYVPELLDQHSAVGIDNFTVLQSGELQVRPALVQSNQTTLAGSAGRLGGKNSYTSVFNAFGYSYIFSGYTVSGVPTWTITCISNISGIADVNYTTLNAATPYSSGTVIYKNVLYVYPSNVSPSGTVLADGLNSYGASIQATSIAGGVFASTVTNFSTYVSDFVFPYRDRVFAVRGNTVYFSKTSDPTLWSGDLDTGYFIVGADTSEPVTALIATRSVLYIFKGSSVYTLIYTSVPTDGLLELINPSVGAVNSNCVAQYQNHIYFASDQKVWEIIGSTVNLISTNIEPSISYFRNLVVYKDTILTYATTVTPMYPNGYNEAFFTFNLQSRAWSSWSFFNDPYVYNTFTIGLANNCEIYQLGVSPGYQRSYAKDTPVFLAQGNLGAAQSFLTYYYLDTSYRIYPDLLYPGGNTGLTGQTQTSQAITAEMETQDYAGGNLDTNAWKRMYTSSADIYLRPGSQGTISLYMNTERNTLDDAENMNTVEAIPYAAPVGGGASGGTGADDSLLGNVSYFTAKFWTNLRVRRYTLKVVLVDSGTSPVSLFKLVSLIRTTVGIESSSGN